LLVISTGAGAQDSVVQRYAPIVTISSLADERLRTSQLRGDTMLAASFFRSASTLTPRRDTATDRRGGWRTAAPELRYRYNGKLPYSLNDGAMWAGRGSNALVHLGALAEWGRARIILLPELAYSENRFYRLLDPNYRVNPTLPPSRNPFSSPWHAGPQSIDLPIRFGSAPFWRLDPGQSSVVVDAGRQISIGAATENEWWGPGIRNALILSNNAPGFPHLFARPSRPIVTKYGSFDARWISGWLAESPYFDDDVTNQTRSISLGAVSWRPPGTTLVLGAARAVYAPATSPAAALGDALNFLADVGQPNAKPLSDPTVRPGRDQLLSLFFRWVQPKDGFEFYGEWGRAEFPVSLRDFLVQPNHTQAYTLGLQWLGEPIRWEARLRAQAEVSFLQQSTTFRTRPIGSWYTSRAVAQGYTNQGQMLGASIGPGSSSQFIALDAIAPRWQLGAYVDRIRWLEDARSQQDYAYDAGYRGFCEHDVSFLPGMRLSALTPLGAFQADYSSGWRLNVFFEHPSVCLGFQPVAPRDVRNKSLTLTFTPATFR
jgi:hypothetical protein